jgi:uncharacterized membrane protein YccC
MIESFMYVGIGLLLGCLLGIAFVPLIQNRAIRLTVKRLERRLPQSIEEIRADKDLLRAQFAMSARRSEIIAEHLRNKMTNQAVELGKKCDIINRLNVERNELKAEITNLRSGVVGSRTAQRPPKIRSVKDHRRRDGIKHRNAEAGTMVSKAH